MGFQSIDAHLVAPKRFVTLAHLNQVEVSDFATLQEVTGLTASDLSKIIRDLEEREIVKVSKERKNRYGTTLIRLSPEGRKTFRNLLLTLNQLAGEGA